MSGYHAFYVTGICFAQVSDGVVLADNTAHHSTTIADSKYEDGMIEGKTIPLDKL